MVENPCAVLEIEVGATLAQIKAAFRRLAKGCHPDRHPNDPEAPEKFRRLVAAYEAILALRKRGGTGKLAEDGSTAPPAAPPPRAGPSWVLWEVTAPAGAGKTREWARGVAQPLDPRRMVDDPAGITWPPGRPHRIILASISIDLLTETAKALAEFGAGNVTVIHSRAGEAGQTVRQKLGKYFAALKAGQDAILLCTHAAAALPVEWAVAAKRGGPERVIFAQAEWDLTIDEAPDVITFLERSWPETHAAISRHVTPEPFRADLLRLRPKDAESEGRLRRLAQGGVPNRDDGYATYMDPAAAIADPTRIVLVNRAQWLDLIATDRDGRNTHSADKLFGGALDLAVVLLPELFEGYRSASVMGARLSSTMAHVLWSKLSNVAYQPHPLQACLLPRHTPAQCKRLRIRYVFEERVTRQFLGRKAEDGKTMFRAACDGIAQFFTTAPFIWTAPLARPGSQHGVDSEFFTPSSKSGYQAFAPALRLPGRTHGLNKFRRYDNAALLSVVNYTPNQYGMLNAMGLSDDKINRAFGYNIIYQDALRCSLRDREASNPVTIVVCDRATAEDLAQDFPGCEVEALPAVFVPALAEKRRPGPQRSGSAASSTDRVRAKRARDRAARDRADDAAKDA